MAKDKPIRPLDELLQAIEASGGTVSRADLLRLLVKHNIGLHRKKSKLLESTESEEE